LGLVPCLIGPWQEPIKHGKVSQQLLILDTEAAECKMPFNRVIVLCYEKLMLPRCPAVLLSVCLYLEAKQAQRDKGSSSSFLQHLMLHAHVEQQIMLLFMLCRHIMQQQD